MPYFKKNYDFFFFKILGGEHLLWGGGGEFQALPLCMKLWYCLAFCHVFPYCFCNNGWPEGHEVSGGELEEESSEGEEHCTGQGRMSLQLATI